MRESEREREIIYLSTEKTILWKAVGNLTALQKTLIIFSLSDTLYIHTNNENGQDVCALVHNESKQAY